MSNYRDDTNETAIASETVWAGIKSFAEDTAQIAAVVLFGLAALYSDSVSVSETITDAQVIVQDDFALVSEETTGRLRASDQQTETVQAQERFFSRLSVLHEDSLRASDELISGVARSVLVEAVTASDQFVTARRAESLIVETAFASDALLRPASVAVEESASTSDWATGFLHVRAALDDSASISDSVIDGSQNAIQIGDSAAASDEASGRLAAQNLVEDSAFADGFPLGGNDSGQAWTACTQGWAMSRYAPFFFTSIAVVDGVLIGTRSDGLYVLGGGQELISSRIKTAKIDIGGPSLAHPLAAYLEYELVGTASLSVTQTQNGVEETYPYALPAELAESLTNARFQLGRGLRGRHFSFELALDGERGHIDELSIVTAQTKRRI